MNISESRIWLIKAITVTAPFEMWQLSPLPYTGITFLLLYIYLLLCAFTFHESFSGRLFYRYSLPLLLIWAIMLATHQVYPAPKTTEGVSILRQFFFLIVFFTFALKDVTSLSSRTKDIGHYLMIAISVMLMIFFFGFTSLTESIDGRRSIEGMNPNLLAIYCAIGILFLVDSLIAGNNAMSRTLPHFMIIILLAGSFIALALSGSRGGLVILGSGLLVYFLTGTRLSKNTLFISLIFFLIIIVATWGISSSGVVAKRLAHMQDDIRLTIIWPAALKFIMHYPLFGGGLDQMYIAISRAVGGIAIAPHNEYLKILGGSGMIGFGFFLVFLGRLLINAFRYRQSSGSGLYIALWLMIVLYLSKGGGALQLPLVWLIFLLLSTNNNNLQSCDEQKPSHPS